MTRFGEFFRRLGATEFVKPPGFVVAGLRKKVAVKQAVEALGNLIPLDVLSLFLSGRHPRHFRRRGWEPRFNASTWTVPSHFPLFLFWCGIGSFNGGS
ncbi:hypothetical protein KI387_005245, partial [Taxus chinensis]